MTSQLIKSRDNAVVKHARAIRDGKDHDGIFVEGLRLCEEAAQGNLEIQHILCTQDFADSARGTELIASLERDCPVTFLVSERVFASISGTKTPQGIILLASRPKAGPKAHLGWVTRNALLVIMHRVSNPANAGAILRTSEAAGATGVISTKGSVDIFSSRALRGSMGSAFRLPVSLGAELSEVMNWCRLSNIRAVCADARSPCDYTVLDWKPPSAVILGAEAVGLTEQEVAMADGSVRVPMRPPVESLNVATACAVILYEAARQRGEAMLGEAQLK